MICSGNQFAHLKAKYSSFSQDELLKAYTKERKRLNRSELNFLFLKQCKQHNLCPAYLKINKVTKLQRLQRVIEICQSKLVKTELRHARITLSNQGNVVLILYSLLTKCLSPLEFDRFLRVVNSYIDIDRSSILSRQSKKLSNLKNQQQSKLICYSNHNSASTKPSKYLNLSKYVPSPEEEIILQKSPKFSFPNTIQPVNILIPRFEKAISNLPKNIRLDVRKKIHNILTNQNIMKQNQQYIPIFRTISNLKNNPQINIIQADKGGQLVIIDHDEFLCKANQCILEIQAVKVASNPTNALISKVAAIKKLLHLPSSILQQCHPPMYPDVPKLFFNIKVHKPERPLRPMVARFCSPIANLEKALSRFLKPFFDSHPYTIYSSLEFKQLLSNASIPESFNIYSLDVVKLFPSVPVEVAKELILDKLSTNGIPTETIQHIAIVLNLILKNVFFIFNSIIYKQCHGAPMGYSISPILAECILQHIESQTFTIFPAPAMYCRYVDDVFVLIDSSCNNFIDIYHNLNSFYPDIQFTYETNQDNNISFLDLQVHVDNNNDLSLSIFRKTSSINNIIPFDSFHSTQHKYSYFNSQIRRALILPTKTEFINQELSYLKQIANLNGFPAQHIHNIIQQSSNLLSSSPSLSSTVKNKPKKFISFPFIEQLHKPLKRILKDTSFCCAYQSSVPLKNMLKKDRDSISPSGGVYSIPFYNSNNIYIGRTQRTLATRIKEHKYSLSSNLNQTSLAQFVHNNNIYPKFSDSKIISSPRDYRLLDLSEAIEIYKNRSITINSNSAIVLDKLWLDLIDKYFSTK